MAKLQPRPSANCLSLGLGLGLGLSRRRGTHGSCEMKVDATMPMMRCDAMCCHVNWQHLRRNLSQDQPADTFNLVRRRDTAQAPMCPNPHCDAGPSSRLADAIWCQVLPLELIMLALSDTLLTSALTFCGFFPFRGKNYLLYPSHMHEERLSFTEAERDYTLMIGCTFS